ncbi:MAG: hypothetical protein WD016_10320 [Balneolaceae bacterium]
MNYKTLSLLLTIVIAFCFSACGGSEKKPSIVPIQNEELIEKHLGDSLSYLDVEASQLSELEQGDEFELKTETGEAYPLIIRRVDEPMPGFKTVTANIEDRETGLATFVIEDNRITGSLNLYKENRQFNILLHDLTGKYYLKEVDETEQDVLEGSEPLNPKSREN